MESKVQKRGEIISTISSNNANVRNMQGVLLLTVIVCVQGLNGTSQKCKILIDSASQGTFIRESCAKLLKLKSNRVNVNANGLKMVHKMWIKL